MMKDRYSLNPKDCVHCHKCKNSCSFLKKYDIDIGDFEKLRELAYHCFLCGRCSAVCPLGIDGRNIVLNMRNQDEKLRKNKASDFSYKLLLLEKRPYKFKNHSMAKGESVFFPGCNFTGFYPKSLHKLKDIFNKAGIGTIYDCCLKPVKEYGLADFQKKYLKKFENELKLRGIKEITALCPNCYYEFKENLSIEVKTVYRKLKELSVGKYIEKKINLFVPCPDRRDKEIFNDIALFYNEVGADTKAQCCGLGGLASFKENYIAKNMPELKDEIETYSYCASCSYQFLKSADINLKHIVTDILDIDEKPDLKHSLLNRCKSKFIRR